MQTAETSPIKILLVDDHAVVRTGLRLIIQSRTDMVIIGEAENRATALALAAAEQPDIILLDLDLGEDSGTDLIAELIEAASRVRIIVFTGLRDPAAHRQAVMRGAMGVVPKEKAADVLINAITRVYAGEAWLDAMTMAGVLKEMAQSNRPQESDREQAKIATLTNREREVLAEVGLGSKNREIAERLFISETTVRHHLTSIFDKLEVSDRVELLIYAYRHGLASPPQPK
jgi:two-component system nitrate/nitrite response regulator NarL